MKVVRIAKNHVRIYIHKYIVCAISNEQQSGLKTRVHIFAIAESNKYLYLSASSHIHSHSPTHTHTYAELFLPKETMNRSAKKIT